MATPQTWEYLVEEDLSGTDLNELGAEGWELVGVVINDTIPTFYFKRLAPDLRERVTLDHRQRFVAAAGEQGKSEA